MKTGISKRCTNRYNHALGTVCNPQGGKGSCFSLTRTVFLDFLQEQETIKCAFPYLKCYYDQRIKHF